MRWVFVSGPTMETGFFFVRERDREIKITKSRAWGIPVELA